MKIKGQFSKPTPFNYQSHQSLQKFRKAPIEQRAQQLVQDIFKIKIKGQQNSKFVTARNSAPTKQDEVKQLKKHIRMLETQLKKKILDNPLLSRIFKTKVPSNGELSHIDLYMEFLALKQQQQNVQKKVEQAVESYKKKQIAYELQIAQLKEEKQQKEQSFITQIQKATEKFQMLQNEFKRKMTEKEKLFQQQTIERQAKIEDQNLIMEELKRKNHKLSKQNKQLQMRFNQYKKNQQQKIKNLKCEFQNYKQRVEDEKKSEKEQIKNEKVSMNNVQQRLEKKIEKLQNEMAEKTLQIQQLDRFIELEKQSFEKQIDEMQCSYQRKLKDQQQKNAQNMAKMEQKHEVTLGKVRRQWQEKLKQTISKYQVELKRVRQELRQDKDIINKLKSEIEQKNSLLKRIQEQIAKYKQQSQSQIQRLRSINIEMNEDKECLLKRVTQSEIRVEKLQKQVQFLTHQKNEIHTKYEKGYMNSQHDIKHYQCVVEQLERKIFLMGNQNLAYKRTVQEKNETQRKINQLKRVNEENDRQKLKSITRIEEMRMKLESYLMNDILKGCFSSTLVNSNSNNYRSNNNTNNNKNQPVTIMQALQNLNQTMERICDGHITLTQLIETLRKIRAEDQRQIESILTHFLSMEDRQMELEQGVLNYINVRKQLSKQLNTGCANSGEEYLHQSKRELSHYLIQKLIQLKVIKQYSSDRPISHSIPVHNSYETKTHLNTANSSRNSFSNQRQSRKSLNKFIEQENSKYSSNHQLKYSSNQQYNSTNQQYNSTNQQFNSSNQQPKQFSKNVQFQTNDINCYDSLQTNNMTQDFSQRNTLANMNHLKKTNNYKLSQRMSTQPISTEQDIEQQSTYQITDENINYGNVKMRQSSRIKLAQQYNSGGQNSDKEQLNKRYKQQIKQKLLNSKPRRQAAFSLSKQDIQKKYFIR